MGGNTIIEFLEALRTFQRDTFGPRQTAKGVIAHMEKELAEIKETEGSDLEELVDLFFLTWQLAHKNSFTAEEFETALWLKLSKCKQRTWPDWRTVDPDSAIEHVRGDEGRGASVCLDDHPGVKLTYGKQAGDEKPVRRGPPQCEFVSHFDRAEMSCGTCGETFKTQRDCIPGKFDKCFEPPQYHSDSRQPPGENYDPLENI